MKLITQPNNTSPSKQKKSRKVINERAKTPLKLSSDLRIAAPIQNKKVVLEKEQKKRKTREVKQKKQIVIEEDLQPPQIIKISLLE